MSIGIFDKGKSDSDFIQNFTKYAESNPEVCEQLSELHTHKIAIAHVPDTAWDSLLRKYSSTDQVRVRVSTSDFLGLPKPVKNCNGVYIFYLMPPTSDLKAEWKEILTGLSDREIVRALVRGENPDELRRFFVHEVMEHLSALTILCKGYLAVHAEDTDISSALDLMGWTEFRKSERGQNLIQQDLSDKKSVVQCPQWWLDVFEQKTFEDDVKKEWKDTTGTEEIPAALSDLLEAIHSGGPVVPSKIVADAYCVLRTKKIRTEISDWQRRRTKSNHTWLKNKFLNSFGDFIGQLNKSVPNLVRMSKFLREDFPAWKTHQQDFQWLVQSFENSMSPRQLLESSPLNLCDDDTKVWLGSLVHGLWLSRYPVKGKVKESQDALGEVNKLYENLASELEHSGAIGLTKLIALRPQFYKLKKTYKVLYRTLGNLPK